MLILENCHIDRKSKGLGNQKNFYLFEPDQEQYETQAS